MEWTVNDAEEKKMVAAGGLEPPRVLPQRILNPSCLPISPRRHRRVVGIILSLIAKAISQRTQLPAGSEFYNRSNSDSCETWANDCWAACNTKLWKLRVLMASA